MPSFSSHDVPDDLPCCSRLARKAESARQARLRHKQFVTDLQEQAATLQARIGQLETHCTTGPGSATVALKELKSALKPEQLEQLTGWLREAQGENHVLARYENGTALPPPIKSAAPMGRSMMSGGAASSYANGGGSAPIAIGGAGASWRGGASASPMESDEGDGGSFPMSRSWDDCEVARSILNLNSPNGFHPLQGPPMGGAPDPFSLGGGGGSLPPMMPSHQAAMGSMLGVQRNRAS